jgi:hypothetical protein
MHGLACGAFGVAIAFFALASGACVDPCLGAGEKVCARACQCATDGKCHILKSATGASSNTTFMSEKDCTNLSELVCTNSPNAKTFDGAACESAMASAQCADDPNGRGVALPAACGAVW